MPPRSRTTFAYSIDDEVLCFEPDEKKARVLYEAKILDRKFVREGSNQKPCYTVHFLGWSRSWDRLVSEHLILQDNEENRELMKKLQAIIKATSGLEKRRVKILAALKRHFGDDYELFPTDQCDASVEVETSDLIEGDVSAEMDAEEESKEEMIDQISLSIPEVLTKSLEEDHSCVQFNHQLHHLPAEPNIIAVLQSYFQYRISQIRDEGEPDLDRKTEYLREVVDGIRIYFDTCLPKCILYNEEKEQYHQLMILFASESEHIKHEPTSGMTPTTMTTTTSESKDAKKSKSTTKKIKTIEIIEAPLVRRSPRTTKLGDFPENQECPREKPPATTPAPVQPIMRTPPKPVNGNIHIPKLNPNEWAVLPDNEIHQHPNRPSLLYGPFHLARLLVLMPSLLCKTELPKAKGKMVEDELNKLLRYLGEHAAEFFRANWIQSCDNSFIG